MGASRKALIAAVETGLVESNLRNLNYGDADSKGWRQERTSIYGNKHATNVALSAQDFFKEAMAKEGQYRRPGDLAAAVQRPAAQFRGRYAQQGKLARQLLGGVGGGVGGSASVPGTPGSLLTLNSSAPDLSSSTAVAQLLAADLQASKPTPAATPLVQPSFSARAALPSGYQSPSASSAAPSQGLDVQQALSQIAALTSASSGPASGQTTIGIPGTADGAASALSVTGGRAGKVSIAAGANAPGTKIDPNVVNFVRQVAGAYGRPLTIGTGTAHSRLTINGTVSDHTAVDGVGRAADVPLTGRALVKAGQDALIAAGMPASKARKITGGGFNVGKWQVIFNTDAPGWGNHLTHLHVGFNPKR